MMDFEWDGTAWVDERGEVWDTLPGESQDEALARITAEADA